MTPSTDKPKRGAPLGNLNSLRNGSRVVRLRLGELPSCMAQVTRYCRQYRRGLEAAVQEAHEEVSLSHAHLIDAACSHEQHSAVCRWLLRQRLGKMSTADIRECSRQIAAAKDSRNKAVAELELGHRPEKDVWARIYAPETPLSTTDVPKVVSGGDDAAGGDSATAEENDDG